MADDWSGTVGSLADEAEKKVLFAALDSFRQYRKTAHYNVTHRRRQNFYALPTSQWQMLAGPPFSILAKFDAVDDAIDANAEIATRILQAGLDAFDIEEKTSDDRADWKNTAKASDLDKARSTIRQFYRDWSAEGAVERRECYDPVLRDLERLFDSKDKEDIKVLIPGAGLGRLAFEACKAGYDVEGNELSYHQLLASSWILNKVRSGEELELYPAALSFSNQTSRENQLKAVKIPDVHAGSELERASSGRKTHAFERMSMTAADFSVLYSSAEKRESFDAVATVFFVDTAPNVIRYIEAIHSTLRPGGYWVNLGPLLWHFEDRAPSETTAGKGRTTEARDRDGGIDEPGSIELTNEELLLLVERMGFSIIEQEMQTKEAGYIQDVASMLQSSYRLSHFVVRKVGQGAGV